MPKRIMIAGAIAHHPLGGAGNAWAFLQFVLGFRRLGFETYYVEHIEPKRCIDTDWKPAPFASFASPFLGAFARCARLRNVNSSTGSSWCACFGTRECE
jgi:hypothetical protein